jgi:signal transduction histidine kinase
MRWEGSFFFIFLLLLGASLFVMYFRDLRKSKAMQAFFSSLSHELKTPLASMRLQAEVIKDMIDDETHSHDQLSSLTKRLIEDTDKLESELEKSLQLSRIEQDGNLTLTPVSLEKYLRRQERRHEGRVLEIKLTSGEVMADELALNMIFRNLIENTLRHNPGTKKITVSSVPEGKYVIVTYDDHGKKFSGPADRLGELFFKYDSSKGSGIGLYLIKSLMKKMRGNFEVKNTDRLQFVMSFESAGGEND